MLTNSESAAPLPPKGKVRRYLFAGAAPGPFEGRGPYRAALAPRAQRQSRSNCRLELAQVCANFFQTSTYGILPQAAARSARH